MAVIKIPNYNRIINLTLLTKSGLNNIVIKCPLRGRKPDIEINGTFSSANYLPSFNVTIKNLYLDLSGEQYTKLQVEAGYEQETIKFTGTIRSLYQESPGPDGKTVIQCQEGNIQRWLDATVDINQKQGAALSTVLNQMAKSLALTPDIKKTAAGLTLPVDFAFQGKTSDAINKIKKMYPEEELRITQREQNLCCISLKNREGIGHRQLNYLSAAPQQNAGGEEGTYYTTINGPWVPGLALYDELEFPSWQYMKNFQLVNTKIQSTKICVTALQFHFSTTGGANTMTVQGYGV